MVRQSTDAGDPGEGPTAVGCWGYTQVVAGNCKCIAVDPGGSKAAGAEGTVVGLEDYIGPLWRDMWMTLKILLELPRFCIKRCEDRCVLERGRGRDKKKGVCKRGIDKEE